MNRIRSIDALRLVLAFCVCVIAYGLPIEYGEYARYVCGFATITYFILCGYLVTRESPHFEARTKSAIKRTAITFAVLAVIYFAINFILAKKFGGSIMPSSPRRALFKFIFFNEWPFPIGQTVWFVQCLLYGYIAMYILYKTGLLKYDVIIFIVCMVINVLTGELAAVIGFSPFGIAYIPATVITRSLPYLLLGRFICRWVHFLEKIPKFTYFIICISGVAATLCEVIILEYYGKLLYTGHFIGNGILAAALVSIATVMPWLGKTSVTPYASVLARVVYYLHDPVGQVAYFI